MHVSLLISAQWISTITINKVAITYIRNKITVTIKMYEMYFNNKSQS